MTTMRVAAIGLVCGLAFGAFETNAAAADATCPQENGVFAHPRDGQKYVSCDKGVATERTCAPGMLWDDLRKSCASASALRHKPPKKPKVKSKKR